MGAERAMRRLGKAVWVLGLVLHGGLATAQGVTLGLQQAYEAARSHDARFRAAQAEQAAGQTFEDIARARLLPQVSLSANASHNRSAVTVAGGPTQDRSYSSSNTSLSLRQPLYDREGWAGLRQGQSRSAASNALFKVREQELALRVTETYTRALLAQDEVQLIEAQLRTLDELYRGNERRLLGGEGTRTDILETGAKRTVLKARLLEATDLASNRRAALESLTGLRIDRLQPLRPLAASVNAGEPHQPLGTWLDRLRRNNPELESLRHAVVVAQAEVQRQESGHYPRLDLVVSKGRSQSDTVATFQQSASTGSIGLQLNLPLYAGGGVTAQVRQAAAQLDKAQSDLEARLAELEVEMHRQHHLVAGGAQRLTALTEALTVSQALVDATQRSVSGGERTNLDVLNAREKASQAQRDLLDARYSLLLSGLILEHLAGSLDKEDLRMAAAEFDLP